MSPHITTTRRPQRRRLAQLVLAGALLAPVATTAALAPAIGVDAATARSSSPEIAEQASAALASLAAWQADGDPHEYVGYAMARDQVAEMAAEALELPAADLIEAWSTTHPVKQQAILAAITQLGVPYRSMTSQEGVGFDCSGLTTFAFASVGVDLPRISRDQIRASAPVTREEAVAGDLVYYPGHVMIYLGLDNAMVHSPNAGNRVEITYFSARRTNTVVFADPLR